MKRLGSLVLVSIFCIIGLPACASPAPAAPINLTWDASPDAASGVVTTYVVYEWKPADTDWVVLKICPASQTALTLVNPAYGTRYTITANDAAGHESAMSNIATNFNLAAPGALHMNR